MVSRKSILSIFFIYAFLMSAAQSAEIIGQVKVESDWFEGKIRWTDGPPSYSYRWKAAVDDGVVILCGAGYYTSGTMRAQTKVLLEDYGFFVDEKIFLKDLTFFAKAKRSAGLVGATANCASTGQQPPKKVKDGVSLRPLNPNKVYRY